MRSPVRTPSFSMCPHSGSARYSSFLPIPSGSQGQWGTTMCLLTSLSDLRGLRTSMRSLIPSLFHQLHEVKVPLPSSLLLWLGAFYSVCLESPSPLDSFVLPNRTSKTSSTTLKCQHSKEAKALSSGWRTHPTPLSLILVRSRLWS